MVPTPKNMVLAHLDPMWPPSAQNPGGMWVLMCVWGVCVLDQPTAARKPGGGGLITLILFTVAKDNRANARLKATKLKKLRDPPSSELPYQRNKETRHEYLQDSGPDLVSAPLPSFRPSLRPSFLPSVLAGVGRTGGGRVGSRARIPYGGLGVL